MRQGMALAASELCTASAEAEASLLRGPRAVQQSGVEYDARSSLPGAEPDSDAARTNAPRDATRAFRLHPSLHHSQSSPIDSPLLKAPQCTHEIHHTCSSMAPKSRKAWLADYIWEEISHVLTWRQGLDDGVKADPDTRFSDDGSNFRSTSRPPDGCDVQLINVLSSKDPTIGFVSDGATRVKAQFSDEAVAAFEEATDESLDIEVTGDVFQIKKVTVVSTPFGPADGFVQLNIEELLYKHHLRKIDGDPKPIEENEHIRLLLENVKTIRVPPIKEEPEEGEQVQPPRPPPIEIDDDDDDDMRPCQVPQSQPPRRSGPSLTRDGYEIERGVNLDQPMRANHLLELMGKPKGKGTAPVPSKTAHQPPPQSARLPTAARSDARSEMPDVRMGDASPEPTLAPAPCEEPSTAVVAETPTKPRPTQSDNMKYGRRKIPDNQRKLLECASSWHPTPPGRTPVHPNVPIELLSKWNAEASAEAQKPSQSGAQTTSPPSKPATPENDAESSSSAADDSSDSEREISSKDWPCSQSIISPSQSPTKPPIKRPPPPSSVEELEVAAPQPLPREPRAMRSPAQMERHLQQHPAERQRKQREEFFERERQRERESKQSGGYISPSLSIALQARPGRGNAFHVKPSMFSVGKLNRFSFDQKFELVSAVVLVRVSIIGGFGAGAALYVGPRKQSLPSPGTDILNTSQPPKGSQPQIQIVVADARQATHPAAPPASSRTPTYLGSVPLCILRQGNIKTTHTNHKTQGPIY
ncbi:uncharacterized protein MYCFIDRAFT_170975 [Pseudocercospora fijiensis CIRAD86]|uniref:Shelterin complex subunit TPP1/Est3 domain-containing protein n=1 Tax=Pseudocercospora fijiensis (strain CIRAD86) TaxID=383855 RepID=N1Q9F6_PSEFD|nr:uncharacterized protein MYCFIDRAFT_170975 [Pseudocercospora fijiensis CIRAD86]EME89530.1 hypothetical protein MYCFIDRAFT_170975 [Pseudocercospora fijiensis CIRAD86]